MSNYGNVPPRDVAQTSLSETAVLTLGPLLALDNSSADSQWDDALGAQLGVGWLTSKRWSGVGILADVLKNGSRDGGSAHVELVSGVNLFSTHVALGVGWSLRWRQNASTFDGTTLSLKLFKTLSPFARWSKYESRQIYEIGISVPIPLLKF